MFMIEMMDKTLSLPHQAFRELLKRKDVEIERANMQGEDSRSKYAALMAHRD